MLSVAAGRRLRGLGTVGAARRMSEDVLFQFLLLHCRAFGRGKIVKTVVERFRM